MLTRLKASFDSAVDSHPLTKSATGGIGTLAAWFSKHAHDLDPYVQAFTLWGGAVIVALTMGCWGLDMRRKWKHRNDPLYGPTDKPNP